MGMPPQIPYGVASSPRALEKMLVTGARPAPPMWAFARCAGAHLDVSREAAGHAVHIDRRRRPPCKPYPSRRSRTLLTRKAAPRSTQRCGYGEIPTSPLCNGGAPPGGLHGPRSHARQPGTARQEYLQPVFRSLPRHAAESTSLSTKPRHPRQKLALLARPPAQDYPSRLAKPPAATGSARRWLARPS